MRGQLKSQILRSKNMRRKKSVIIFLIRPYLPVRCTEHFTIEFHRHLRRHLYFKMTHFIGRKVSSKLLRILSGEAPLVDNLNPKPPKPRKTSSTKKPTLLHVLVSTSTLEYLACKKTKRSKKQGENMVYGHNDDDGSSCASESQPSLVEPPTPIPGTSGSRISNLEVDDMRPARAFGVKGGAATNRNAAAKGGRRR